MDRKSFLVLVVCFFVLMAWYPMLNRLYPPGPGPRSTNTVVGASNQVQTLTNAAAANHILEPTIRPATNLVAALPKPDQPEKLLTLENKDARYIFTSHGGGLKAVELKEHRAIVGNRRRNGPARANLATLNAKAPAPVLALLDAGSMQADGIFTLTQMAADSVRAEKQLTNGLRLIKEFRLSTNYLVETKVRLENQGNQPLGLPPQEWSIGTATPMNPTDADLMMLGVMLYNGSDSEEVGDAWFANRSLGCFPGVPRTLYVSGSNIVWAAVHNQFFALAVIPREPAPQLVARRIDLPPPSLSEVAADSRTLAKPVGFQASFVYPGAILAPQQSWERHYHIYAGPKEYNTLARIGVAFNNKLDLIMRFGFFGFFAKALLLSMNGLHALGLGYGMAIIVITVIIKLVFWPLTNASTKSMKRMAALQPQMKALQEKYKDDPKKMNLKLMEFMKENRVSPVSGCVPMLLQIPVFFGFYTMLQSAIELRGAPFLWASDLSTSDTVWVIPGLNFPVNLLPLIMGATMIWQARMTPPAPGMDPVQQKIMKYMPLMFMVFLYNFSAGLTLYWTVQNLLTIAQMKLTKNVKVELAKPQRPPTPTPGAFGPRRPKH